jgi:hypothetical protein
MEELSLECLSRWLIADNGKVLNWTRSGNHFSTKSSLPAS